MAPLRDAIAEAFPLEPIPRAPIVDTAQWDEGASEYFLGTPWTGHSVQNLRRHEAAMCFFTPQAHRYYLPAFMLAVLDDPKGADVIPDNIIFHFSKHRDEFWRRRVDALTPVQRRVVAQFIAAVADGYAKESGQVNEAITGLMATVHDG